MTNTCQKVMNIVFCVNIVRFFDFLICLYICFELVALKPFGNLKVALSFKKVGDPCFNL